MGEFYRNEGSTPWIVDDDQPKHIATHFSAALPTQRQRRSRYSRLKYGDPDPYYRDLGFWSTRLAGEYKDGADDLRRAVAGRDLGCNGAGRGRRSSALYSESILRGVHDIRGPIALARPC